MIIRNTWKQCQKLNQAYRLSTGVKLKPQLRNSWELKLNCIPIPPHSGIELCLSFLPVFSRFVCQYTILESYRVEKLSRLKNQHENDKEW